MNVINNTNNSNTEMTATAAIYTHLRSIIIEIVTRCFMLCSEPRSNKGDSSFIYLCEKLWEAILITLVKY